MGALIKPFKGCQHPSGCGWCFLGRGKKCENLRIFQNHPQLFPTILGTLVIILEAPKASALMAITSPQGSRGPEAVGTSNLGLEPPTNACAFLEV